MINAAARSIYFMLSKQKLKLMKRILILLLFIAGFTTANGQLLKKIGNKLKQTASSVENTIDNKVQNRTTQEASDKTDKMMNKVFEGRKKKKNKTGNNNEPPAKNAEIKEEEPLPVNNTGN